MSEDLLLKLQKDENFRKQNQKNKQKYEGLLQAATYSETKNIPNEIFRKVQGRVIYLYFGYLQPTIKKYMGQVAMFLAKNFQPDETKSYKFVFFNDYSPDNYVLWNFRETFTYLKLEQIVALQQFIVVKPYFYHKTMDWMTFGTLPKFIRSRTKFIYSYRELCQYLNCDLKFLLDYVPPLLYEKELPQLFKQAISLSQFRMNIHGQSRTHQENIQQLQFRDKILSIIEKGSQQHINLQDYEVGPEGVPTILKMLIFYFDSHQQGLKIQGLFRKSASIDELTQTINKIAQNNYDSILEVQNPHVIANLIKKFFNSLKTRIFPQSLVDELVDDKDIEDKAAHLKDIYSRLPQINKITLTFLFTFLRDKLLKYSIYNKMSVEAISVCFNPCLFGDKSLSSIEKGKKYCRILLQQYEMIFGQQQQRNNLYRVSYVHTQKQFQQQVDIGLKRLTQSQSAHVDFLKGSQRISHHFDSGQAEVLQFLGQAYIKTRQQKQFQQKKYQGLNNKQINLAKKIESQQQKQKEDIEQKQKIEQREQKKQENKQQQNNGQFLFIDTQQQPSAWRYTRNSMQIDYDSIQDAGQIDWLQWKDQQNKEQKNKQN